MQSNNYLLEIAYLGFRYSGWMIQPKVKTVQGMLNKTITFVLPQNKFKTMACSRTDAKVSAKQNYIGLYLDNNLPMELADFLTLVQENLPQDISLLSIVPMQENTNILGIVKHKTYRYNFSSCTDWFPFSAAQILQERHDLNIEAMKKAAELFQGEHDFRSFSAGSNPDTETLRVISKAEIISTEEFTGEQYPAEVYCFIVEGSGFLRYQIRMMMGQLIAIGQGDQSINDLKNALVHAKEGSLKQIAPGSGLCLEKIELY